MTKPNVALLEETLTYIRDHPEEWDQTKWVCGTAACFAGRAALLSGHTVPQTHTTHVTDMVGWFRTDGDERVGEVAERELGITFDQAEDLFNATNTMDDLEHVVKNIINESQAENV